MLHACRSTQVDDPVSSYAVGVIKGNQLVLVPLDFSLQLRPNMTYLNPSKPIWYPMYVLLTVRWASQQILQLHVYIVSCLSGWPLVVGGTTTASVCSGCGGRGVYAV